MKRPMRRLFILLLVTAWGCCAVAQQAATRPAITGIAFVNFTVTDVAAADKFDGGTLGLRRISTAEDASRGPLTIFAVNGHQWISVAPGAASAAQGKGRLGAVGFRTANAAQLGAYLAAHGYFAVRPVAAGELVVPDPEGNTICFLEDGAISALAHAAPSPRNPRG